MNYGKLTAGTTKTAIDTAKPSEKGEIITYLSRMGDVLEQVSQWSQVVVAFSAVHGVIDGNEADAFLWENHFRVHTDLQIVSTEPRHIFDNYRSDFPGFDICKHFLKIRAVKVRTGETVIGVPFQAGEAVLFGVALQKQLLI